MISSIGKLGKPKSYPVTDDTLTSISTSYKILSSLFFLKCPDTSVNLLFKHANIYLCPHTA